jgi:hypothetical protein
MKLIDGLLIGLIVIGVALSIALAIREEYNAQPKPAVQFVRHDCQYASMGGYLMELCYLEEVEN